MPPKTPNTSPEPVPKKPKSPQPPQYYNTIVKPYTYNIYVHPRTCLILFIIALQFSLLTLSYYNPYASPSSLSNTKTFIHRTNNILLTNNTRHSNSNSSNNSTAKCELGRFYVYELPSELNVDIYKNCDKLSPWGSRCSALSNNGFGLVASEINRVVPVALVDTWYWTDQFSSEIIFHNRLLNHKCRTKDPESATAFYIPSYAGLALGKYLWGGTSAKDRDSHCETMLHYIEQFPYFNRSNGFDHFINMARITWDFRRSKDEDWGSNCIHMSSMHNITRLLIERNPWDNMDVGIPYPTGFHPNSDSDVTMWQDYVKTRARGSLFCFAGGTRGLIPNDFRGLLLDQCRDSAGACRVVDCSGIRCANGTAGTTEILETFLDSEFCLQPRGDSFTRRSIFECMIAGSIPVFFWRRSAYLQYEWFLPEDPKSYSVFIHRDEVKNGTSIKSVLDKYSKEEIQRMRANVVKLIPKFIYARPNEGLGTIKDAVDIAVDGVLRRIKERKENGNYL